LTPLAKAYFNALGGRVSVRSPQIRAIAVTEVPHGGRAAVGKLLVLGSQGLFGERRTFRELERLLVFLVLAILGVVVEMGAAVAGGAVAA
jgi:hypothetical protein